MVIVPYRGHCQFMYLHRTFVYALSDNRANNMPAILATASLVEVSRRWSPELRRGSSRGHLLVPLIPSNDDNDDADDVLAVLDRQ